MRKKSTVCPFCQWEEWPHVKEWSIKVKAPAVSQNELGGNNRGSSGFKYRRIRRKFEQLLSVATAGIPRATGFRRMVLTRHYGKGKRAFDYGNLVGGAKCLIDALVSLGLLRDDAPKYFLCRYLQLPSTSGSDYVTLDLEERLCDET